MPRFNTQYDRVDPFTYESNVGPSETIPDDSLSIPEILAKYIRGQRIDGSFPGGFEESEEGLQGDFDSMFEDLPEGVEAVPAAAPAAAPAADPAAAPAPSQGAQETSPLDEGNSTK